jgi:hypothetical protein
MQQVDKREEHVMQVIYRHRSPLWCKQVDKHLMLVVQYK